VNVKQDIRLSDRWLW